MSIAAVQARIAEIQARMTGTPASSPGASAQFNSVMSAAMAQATGTVAAPAGVGAAGGAQSAWSPHPVQTGHVHNHGKVEPPPELRAYGNGRIPASALTPIGDGNHRLWRPAAQAFNQLRADAAAAGVNIGVTDSYRSYEAQVDLAERKGLYSQGGLAATPGTSNHGWGLSLDLDLDPKAQAWMRANGGRYGFVEDVPREPWHWTFHGSKA